jgi:hypothetical protein
MLDLQVKFLKYVDPFASPSIGVWNSIQPLQWFMINSKCKMILKQIFFEMHYTLYQQIAFTLHKVEFFLIGENFLLT